MCDGLKQLAPLELSEAWDNTGLLLGDPAAAVERVMTCLTLTPASAEEAIRTGAQLVIAHHPLPFKPLARITTESYSGRLVWELARAGVAVYSPHTAWDSASTGINAQLAELLELDAVLPLVPAGDPRWPGVGAGRWGSLPQPQSLEDVARKLAAALPGCRPRVVRPEANPWGTMPCAVSETRLIRKIGICCGSGGSLLAAAVANQCDMFLTGEGTFHTCLEAHAAGIFLLMIGHFASERFAMLHLANQLAQSYPGLTVWASNSEKDPVSNLNLTSIPG